MPAAGHSQLWFTAATAAATLMIVVVASLQLWLFYRQSHPKVYVFVDLTTQPGMHHFQQLHARIANLSPLGIWVRELEMEVADAASPETARTCRSPAHVVVGAYDKQDVPCHGEVLKAHPCYGDGSQTVAAVISIRVHYLAGGRWKVSRWQKFAADLDGTRVKGLRLLDA
jgi:hypothetical protein